MSLSSHDQEFLHRCIYDFFLWNNDKPLMEALEKAHPEACQHRTSQTSDPPLLMSALRQYRDTQDSTTNHNGREASSSTPMMVDEPTSQPVALGARTTGQKRKERSSTTKVPNHNLLITASTTKTTTAARSSSVETKSPFLAWKDYCEVLIQQKISKEQIPPDSLDPRGMLSWCVHQRWVYKKYHGKSMSKDGQEAASHLSTERIQKLESLGFEWDMTKETHPQDCSDQIVVDRQTQSPAQLNQWKQALEQYKPYFSTIRESKGKNAQSSIPARRRRQQVEQDEDDVHDKEDEMDDNESSVQEKAQEWLAVQIQRYREWDAGFVDFTKEQRDALHALHLLPELTEQGDHNRYNMLLLGNKTATSEVQGDEPSDNGNDNDSDNESSSSDTEDDEQESDDGQSDTKSQQDRTRVTNGGSSHSTSKVKRTLQADELWQTHFQELLDFQKKHGHIQVTRRMDLKLARWSTKERAKYRKSKDSYPKDRKKKLDDIGFCWEPTALSTKLKIKTPSTPSRSTVIDWGERLQQMKAFHKKYGHVHVTNSLDAKLSSWVKKERIRYRQNKDAYPIDRKKSLDDLGFCWEPIVAIKNQEHEPYPGTMAAEKDAIWWKRYQELKEFKERFGHVRVPSRWNENRELSNWYRHTKERYRGFLDGLNRFPKSRQKALEEIDFHQLSQITRAPKAKKTNAIDPSENNKTLEAVEIPTKSDEESADDQDAASARSIDATDSDTSQQKSTGDSKPGKTTESIGKDGSAPKDGNSHQASKQQIDPPKAKNDDIANPAEILHSQRAVLWTSSRKRMRLPMQHEAKQPSRSEP